MLQLKIATLFAIAALLTTARAYDNLRMIDLPDDISKQVQYLLGSPITDLNPNCTDSKIPPVKFLLYSQDFPNIPIELDPSNPSQVKPRQKIVLIVHGWLAKPGYSKITQLKDAYLKRYNDANLILVDWTAAALALYEDAYCAVPNVAHELSDFLCNLSDRFNLHLSVIHMIGHSFGGQVAGHAGKQVVKKCNMQVGRITGLDPSGLVYEKLPKSERLDAGDAEFVDVIHTSGLLGVGFYTKCGHVDFHPNCKYYPQPGCKGRGHITNETLVTDAFCEQDRALQLMTESVYTKDLVAVSCSMCPRYCSEDILTEIYQVMGEDCRQIPKPAKNFFIPTNEEAPYGQGWLPFPNARQARLEGFCKKWPLEFLNSICSKF